MKLALVHDYLREYGVPAQRLLPPEAYVLASEEHVCGVKGRVL